MQSANCSLTFYSHHSASARRAARRAPTDARRHIEAGRPPRYTAAVARVFDDQVRPMTRSASFRDSKLQYIDGSSDNSQGGRKAVSVSRLTHIPQIGVEQMGDLADSLNTPEILRLKTLDPDLRPPQRALEFTKRAVDDDSANSYLPLGGSKEYRMIG